MNFAQKLQKKRKDAGFSQEQLAFELNVSRQAVSKWESGQGYPEVEKLIQLSELLGVSLDELMKETSEAPLSESAEERIQENTWNDDALMIFHLRLRSRRNR
ncbi:MAG: helix-turn-helix domain-containing protein [Holdemania massiliensis]